jgi:hypothetical protein
MDEISDETYQANLLNFPSIYKKNISYIIDNELLKSEQLLICYYNKYKNDRRFSFEHLMSIIKNTGIIITKILTRYKRTGVWAFKIPSHKSNNIIKLLLE